jgi:hypothetical protein
VGWIFTQKINVPAKYGFSISWDIHTIKIKAGHYFAQGHDVQSF